MSESPTPGAQGPAIVLGHVNGGGKPGVFLDLIKVEPGRYDINTAQLVMKPYVDIEGSGEGLTRIVTRRGAAVRLMVIVDARIVDRADQRTEPVALTVGAIVHLADDRHRGTADAQEARPVDAVPDEEAQVVRAAAAAAVLRESAGNEHDAAIPPLLEDVAALMHSRLERLPDHAGHRVVLMRSGLPLHPAGGVLQPPPVDAVLIRLEHAHRLAHVQPGAQQHDARGLRPGHDGEGHRAHRAAPRPEARLPRRRIVAHDRAGVATVGVASAAGCCAVSPRPVAR